MATTAMKRIAEAQQCFDGQEYVVGRAVDDAKIFLEANNQSYSPTGELRQEPWFNEMLRATNNRLLLMDRRDTLLGRIFGNGLFFTYSQLKGTELFQALEENEAFFTVDGKPREPWATIVSYVTNATTRIICGALMAMHEDARERKVPPKGITLKLFHELHMHSKNTSPQKTRDNRLVPGYVPLGLVRARQHGPHDGFNLQPGLVARMFFRRVFIPLLDKYEPMLVGVEDQQQAVARPSVLQA